MHRPLPIYRVTLACVLLVLGLLVAPSFGQRRAKLPLTTKALLVKPRLARGMEQPPPARLHSLPPHRAVAALMKRLQPAMRIDDPNRRAEEIEDDNGLRPANTFRLERDPPPAPVRTLTVRVYTKDPADFLTSERARYPLPNAAVEISPVYSGGTASWTSLARTGSEGELQKRLRAGQYRVTVSKPGYYWLRPGSSRTTTVSVFGDQELTLLLYKDRDYGVTDMSVVRGEYWFLYQQYYYVHDDYYGRDELVDYHDWRRFAGPFRTREDLRDWKEDNAPTRSGLRGGYDYRELSRHTWFDPDTSWQ